MRRETAPFAGGSPVLPVATGRALAALFLAAMVIAFPHPGRGATLAVKGPDRADVLLNGRPVGTLPLSDPLTVKPGVYRLRCVIRGYRPFEVPVNVGEPQGEYVVYASLTRMSRAVAVGRDILWAGLGQDYLDRPGLGHTLTVIEAGGVATAIAGEHLARSRRADYNNAYDAYQHAVSESAIAAAKQSADSDWRKVKDATDLRRDGVIVAVCAVAVGVLDAWLRFPGIDAGPAGGPAHAMSAADPADLGAARGEAAVPGIRIAWRVPF